MESSILVSVIICTYNQEDTISQTIDSVLIQDVNFDFEIITKKLNSIILLY